MEVGTLGKRTTVVLNSLKEDRVNGKKHIVEI